MTLWSLPVFVPLMLRRYRPEPAAWLFVALTITHLVLGPAITYFDFYALIMVYSVILYGSPRHSWRFIVTAFVMGLVAATVWSVSFNVGPLFAGTFLRFAHHPRRLAGRCHHDAHMPGGHRRRGGKRRRQLRSQDAR